MFQFWTSRKVQHREKIKALLVCKEGAEAGLQKRSLLGS